MYSSAYPTSPVLVAEAAPSERATFIRKTFFHLGAAILAFVGIESVLLNSPVAPLMLNIMGLRFGWLMILGGFMGISWLANRWAVSNTSVGMQYLGLGLYVVAEAIIFVPILYIARYYSSPEVIPTAAIITMALVFGLIATAFITKKDFSFLKPILTFGFLIALGLIVCATLFGFNLGLWFSLVMVVFAAGSILYTLSNMQYEYNTQQHVAASLALFASVALLFWYILRILMSRRS